MIKFSASGSRDFTRIAASDPTMWRDIFMNNKEAVLEILGRFTEDVRPCRRRSAGASDALFDLFARTRAIRRGIIDSGQDTPARISAARSREDCGAKVIVQIAVPYGAFIRRSILSGIPGLDLWVFVYLLMWRPGFRYEEASHALLEGAHRALCPDSVVDRGVPTAPGLVFGLDKGGKCEGMAFRWRCIALSTHGSTSSAGKTSRIPITPPCGP